MYLWAGLALCILLSYLLFQPVRVAIFYHLVEDDDDLVCQIIWLGRAWWQIHIPVVIISGGLRGPRLRATAEVKLGETGREVLEMERTTAWQELWQNAMTVGKLIQRYRFVLDFIYAFVYGLPPEKKYMPLGQRSLGYLMALISSITRHVEEFRWRTRVGVGDAAVTAIITGSLWTIKTTTLALLQGLSPCLPSNVHLEVLPDFEQRRVKVDLSCIFRLNIGHIMIAGLRNLARAGIKKGVNLIGQRP